MGKQLNSVKIILCKINVVNEVYWKTQQNVHEIIKLKFPDGAWDKFRSPLLSWVSNLQF